MIHRDTVDDYLAGKESGEQKIVGGEKFERTFIQAKV